jgi:hypothetical protein
MQTKNAKNRLLKLFREVLIAAGMALASVILFAFISFAFSGCATKEYIEVVKTVEVKTPVRCDLPTPKLAQYNNTSAIKNEANIYIYTETLEATLRACKGQK